MVDAGAAYTLLLDHLSPLYSRRAVFITRRTAVARSYSPAPRVLGEALIGATNRKLFVQKVRFNHYYSPHQPYCIGEAEHVGHVQVGLYRSQNRLGVPSRMRAPEN